jgi:hypothetical protein
MRPKPSVDRRWLEPPQNKLGRLRDRGPCRVVPAEECIRGLCDPIEAQQACWRLSGIGLLVGHRRLAEAYGRQIEVADWPPNASLGRCAPTWSGSGRTYSSRRAYQFSCSVVSASLLSRSAGRYQEAMVRGSTPLLLANSLRAHFLDTGDFAPFIAATADLTGQQAAYRPRPDLNSIWTVTAHIARWQLILARELDPNPPPRRRLADDWSQPPDVSTAAWLAARERAIEANARLVDVVSGQASSALEVQLSAWSRSIADAIITILGHNAYHIGEMMTLRPLAIGRP